MDFQSGLITVKTTQGEQHLEAVHGIGSGLAYHRLEGKTENDFVLTHVASGFSIASEWYAWDEKDARRWLANVSILLNWTKPLKSVKSAVMRRGGIDAMRDAVTQALREAVAVGDKEALAHPEPEPVPIEDGVPPNWPDTWDSLKTVCDG